MPILWYQEMFAESCGPFCGYIIYQKCAHRIGKQKEAKREKWSLRPDPAGLELATFETRGERFNHSAIELTNRFSEIRKSVFNANPDRPRDLLTCDLVTNQDSLVQFI